MPHPFKYFDIAEVHIAGERLLLTHTGFTNELGSEFYLEPGVNAQNIRARLGEVGQRYGLLQIGVEGIHPRRIEAGILSARSDFDSDINPFEAGLGAMVGLSKPDFVGKQALEAADQQGRL